MKVCLVSTIGYPNRTKLGGVPSCTRNMAHALAGHGTEVHVITKKVDGAPFKENDGPVKIHGLPLGNLHYYFGRLAPIGMWPRVIKALEWGRNIGDFIKQLHQESRIDLVIYSNVWIEGFWHPSSVPFAVRMDTPLFAARPVSGCGDRTGWNTFERMEQRVVRRADAVICLTELAAQQVQSEYRISSDQTVVIPNPVDLNRFRPCDSPRSDGLRIFHPGPRLDDWQKGTHILLQAMEDVIIKFPNAQLVLAGKGKPDLSKVSGRVVEALHFLGWLDPSELAQQYALADLTVVPSLNYDSFPSVCLESLATGTPVIGSAVGGIPDVIQSEETGLIVPPGDPRALGAAIIRAFSDVSLLNRMQRQARQVAEQNYSLDLVGRKMLNLCEQLVSVRALAV